MPNVDCGTDNTKEETKVLPEFLETPTTLSMQTENCLTTKRLLSFEDSEADDFKMLQEVASRAVSTFTKQNESDEEDFLFTIPKHNFEENKKGPGKHKHNNMGQVNQ